MLEQQDFKVGDQVQWPVSRREGKNAVSVNIRYGKITELADEHAVCQTCTRNGSKGRSYRVKLSDLRSREARSVICDFLELLREVRE